MLYNGDYNISGDAFMDKLTEQYFRTKIEEIREKLEERRCLNEWRIPANMELLNSEMESVPELKKLLTMPAREMKNSEEYKNYLYLLGEVLPEKREDNTLLDAVQISLQALKDHCYFSVNKDNELRGFIAYIKGDGNYVKQLKMFSFNQKGDLTLAADLEDFVEELCATYDFVSWSAAAANGVNAAYEIALKKLEKKGFSTESRPVKYVIKNKIPEKSNGIRYFVSKKHSKKELKIIAKEFKKYEKKYIAG